MAEEIKNGGQEELDAEKKKPKRGRPSKAKTGPEADKPNKPRKGRPPKDKAASGRGKTLGDKVELLTKPGLGRLPNKRFCKAPVLQKSQVWAHLHCLSFCANLESMLIFVYNVS